MGTIISASIDLAKINKSKIVEGKNGAKYYNILISVNDEKNQYGQDVAISENQSEEDRKGGVKKNYLGNGKTIWTSQRATNSNAIVHAQQSTDSNDQLPF